MTIAVGELSRLVNKALKQAGFSDNEASIIAEVLLYAQYRGNNQGIAKLAVPGGVGSLKKDATAGDIITEKETKLSARLNGNRNVGFVVMRKATELAISKAKEHGFGIVGTNNTCTATGAIGYYAERCARSGLIGFAFSSCVELMCTHGSYERTLGTNPLAIGIPSATGADPIVLDIASSAMAYYGLVEAKAAGQSIPPDVGFDANGQPTTDPHEVIVGGALRPFDRGPKGSGLAVVVELLCGPLVGAGFACLYNNDSNWGNLVFAIDPALLWDADDFGHKVHELVNRIKAAKRLPGVDEIFLPGERGNQRAAEVAATGFIEIQDELVVNLRRNVGEDCPPPITPSINIS